MEENNETSSLKINEELRRHKISETKKRKFAENGSPLKGRAKSESHKLAIGAANLGKRRTPEERARMREARMAVGFTDEQRKAAGDRLRANPLARGLKWTEDQRQRLADRKIGSTPLLRKYGIEPEEYERQIALGNKWCSFGKHFVSADEVYRDRGFCENCKTAHHRAILLRNKYGVTAEWYIEKLLSQGGGCAICGSTKPSKGWNFLAIDHSHSTGETRGILCGNCNFRLSVFEDHEFSIRTVRYLAQYGTRLTVEEIPMEPALATASHAAPPSVFIPKTDIT